MVVVAVLKWLVALQAVAAHSSVDIDQEVGGATVMYCEFV